MRKLTKPIVDWIDRTWPDCLDPNASHNRRERRIPYQKPMLGLAPGCSGDPCTCAVPCPVIMP